MSDLLRTPAAEVRLKVIHSAVAELRGKEMTLTGPTIWFGRLDGNDVVVPDPSVSSRHAWLEVTEPGRFVLHDNDSSNGVLVGSEKITESEVAPGQRFTLGSTIFELLAATPPPVPAAPPRVDRTMFIRDFKELAKEFERPQALTELGEPLVTHANAPFLIFDANSMWLVESGKVEVFTVAVDAGKPTGARSHFVTVEPKEGFFGLDADSAGYPAGFLAAGRAGSELRRFDIGRLQFFAQVPVHSKRVAEIVSTWVAKLSRRLTSDLPSVPDSQLVLRPGEATPLPAETVVTSGNEVVWIELAPARYLFDGMASLSYEVEGVLFPIAPGSWFELLASEEPLEVLPKKTEEVIADSRLWAGLEAFHRALMEGELLNKRLALVDERDRLERKAERAEAAREAGIGAIEAVLGGASRWQKPVEVTGLGPVVGACRLVADFMEIQVQRPVGDLETLSFEETLLSVAASSRFRTRQVTLVDDWWNRDQGALVGQREEDKAPIALLPTGRAGGYDCIDPESGERTPVTEAVAETLAPFAYSFYKPFPDGRLGAKDLIRFGVRGLKKEFREVMMMALAVGLLGTVTPIITGMVFDSAIPQAERPFLLQLCLGLLLVALATSAFKVTQNVAMLRVQTKMEYGVQSAIWDRLLNLPTTFFRRYSAGDLADRAAAADRIRGIVAGAGVAAVLGSIASLFNAVQMMFYSFAMAGVAILLTLLYVGMTTTCNYLKLRLERTEMARRGRLNGMVLELINGVAKLRVSGTEDHAFRVWATEFAGMRKTAFKVGRIGNFMPMINKGFPVLSSLAIFLTMAKLQQRALAKGEAFDLSTGDFLAFNAAFGVFLGAMQALGDASVNMLEIVPVFERLKPVLEEEAEVDGTKSAPNKLRGGIELSHVHFRYVEDGAWILKDVSLKIEPGEFIALVGGSGSGKSTLMKIMLGFEKPQKGAVYFDGQDLATLDVRLVRQQLGVVLQESRLLPADIYRNIVGSSSRTVQDAWEAANKSGLAEDIKRMPMGMHTYVSEGGGGFSGGQKQRLMIARALVHNPKILFLDEATSALDNRTQAIVTESMDRLQATRIVIAHRLSTVVNADRICYLDKGELKEQGTYDELMELDGLFAELAKRQMA